MLNSVDVNAADVVEAALMKGRDVTGTVVAKVNGTKDGLAEVVGRKTEQIGASIRPGSGKGAGEE